MVSRFFRRVALAVLLGALATSYAGNSADARGQTFTYDVSYPQCGRVMPGNADHTIIGVDGGYTFANQPCLLQLVQWAHQVTKRTPAFYINTGNPGPGGSAFWPIGQQVPKPCTAAKPNSQGCSYDFGWNSAVHSFRKGVAAEKAARHISWTAAHANVTDASTSWWLDVEMGNSWQTLKFGQTLATQKNDVQALGGAVDALKASGVHNVGIYATVFQWGQITGGPAVTGNRFANTLAWLAGYHTRAEASTGCHDRTFSGGPVVLTQYGPENNLDLDFACPRTPQPTARLTDAPRPRPGPPPAKTKVKTHGVSKARPDRSARLAALSRNDELRSLDDPRHRVRHHGPGARPRP